MILLRGASLLPDWDKAYRDAQQPLFGDAPTAFVKQIVERRDFRVKSALCLADGDGRHGRWLAAKGIKVTAIDLSSVATEQALARDAAANVTVKRLVGDLAHWQFDDSDRWDAVFLIFLQCESNVRNRIAAAACQHLSDGGWFVAEGFSNLRSETARLGPHHPDLLYDLSDLKSSSAGLSIVKADTVVAQLDEGLRHCGEAVLTQFVARRL